VIFVPVTAAPQFAGGAPVKSMNFADVPITASIASSIAFANSYRELRHAGSRRHL
jgi:hypothetical protein